MLAAACRGNMFLGLCWTTVLVIAVLEVYGINDDVRGESLLQMYTPCLLLCI